MHALAQEAAREGLALPGRDSLRIMISRWENGRVQPDENYRRYLSAVYDADPVSLGLRAAGPSMPGVFPAAGTPRICEPLLQHLDRSLDEYVRADNELGATAVLPLVEQQAALLDDLAAGASGKERREVLARGSRYAEMCGWLRQDVGDLAGAQRWSDRALEYVEEVGDAQDLSYVLMRKSNIASDRDQPARALGLAEAALRNGAALTPSLRAVALRQQAAAHARSGEGRLCAEALDRAASEVATADPQETHTGYVTEAFIASEAGQCWLDLGAPQQAEEKLRSGLAAWPDEYHRDRAIGLCRLATALVDQKRADEAADTVRQATELATAVASPRLHARLYQLRNQLQRWWAVDSVASVADAIAVGFTGQRT